MTFKEQVRAALDGDHPVLGHSVVFALYALIAFSTLSIGIETIPDLPQDMRIFLTVMEWITVVAFTVEYALRIWIAPDKLAYIRSFYGIIDLLAILPFYLSFGLVDMRALRAFRLFRLLRLFKVARYNRATRRIATALKLVREELIVFAAFALFTLYLCGIGIYYCEHDAQPKVFASVFDGIWWAAVTLTTVGYGDVYPVTVGGRLFTMCIMFVALGAIAVPTGLISSAMTRLRHAEEEAEDAAPHAEAEGRQG
jgi:voltage-gated potassium channel